jgi:hypothetical protein
MRNVYTFVYLCVYLGAQYLYICIHICIFEGGNVYTFVYSCVYLGKPLSLNVALTETGTQTQPPNIGN